MTEADCQNAQMQARTTASRLGLPFGSKVWRGPSGEFLGAGVGSSLDFQDHRTYLPGDDPRHINWQAYARTGSYTMKLYREEVRPTADLVFDVSESMHFLPEKAARALELCYFAVESARRAGADTRITLASGPELRPVAPEAFQTHLWIREREHLAPTDPSLAPDLSRVPFRPGSIRLLVSDLLFEGDPQPILQQLGGRHGSPILLCPFTAAEADPAWQGHCDFIDAERHSHHPHRIDSAVLRRYRDAYAKHFGLWKDLASRHRSRLARIPCGGDLAQALAAEAVALGAVVQAH
jgi:uncharacterized protein (DUF58 family)